jgi:hypothetical protein
MTSMTAAEMRVPVGRGLGVPDARELRLRVEDDQLVLHRPGHPARVVTTVPSATGMVWLSAEETLRLLGTPARSLRARVLGPGGGRYLRRRLGRVNVAEISDALPADAHAASGSLVVLEHDTPVLALELNRFVSGGHDEVSVRELSGANRLARGMGLVLERGDASLFDRSALSAVAVAPWRPDARWVAGSVLLCLLSAVVGFAGWPFPDTLTDRLHALLTLAACLLLVPPVVGMVRGRLRFLRLVSTPPDPAGRAVVPVGTSELQLGPRDVVLVDPAGVEYWLPGPDAGGVRGCELAEDLLVWLDGAESTVGPPLKAAEVVPDEASRERLRTACGSAGIVFTDTGRLPSLRTAGLPYALSYDDNWHHPLYEHGWEVGVVSRPTEYLSLVAVLVTLPAVIGATVASPLLGWLALLLWLGCAGARTWVGVVFRRRRRALIRAERRPREELRT